MTLHGDTDTAVPGPHPPPLVPGHLGQPSYAECASLAALVGLCDHYGWPVPPTISPGFANRLRDWVKREFERGNLDKLVAAAGGDDA
jgi:hypothetical protein